jgi:hypothetical protein
VRCPPAAEGLGLGLERIRDDLTEDGIVALELAWRRWLSSVNFRNLLWVGSRMSLVMAMRQAWAA